MKTNTEITRPGSTKRRAWWSAAVLLGIAFSASACLSIDKTAEEPTTSETTVVSEPGPTTTEAAPSSTTVPPPTNQPEPAADDVEAYLEELDSRGFTGVVAVQVGDEISTRAFGVADRENDVPIDTGTVFDIGSLTKQLTGAAILRLEMDGRLSVEDTLGQHVPGLPEDKAAITLHQLLTHTAGVPVGFGPDEQPIGRDEFLLLVAATPLESEPGERYAYSNVGYSLLAAVIEFETGEPYEHYLREAVLEPAGMLDTGYLLPDWDGHTIAVGYVGQPDEYRGEVGDRFGRPNEQPWDIDGPYWNLLGNGGLMSTAADMLAWDEALEGEDVLDADAKAKFFAPHVLDGPQEGVHSAYGWNVVPTPLGSPVIFHSGSNGVFWADLLRFTEQDVTVFLATNSLTEGDPDIGSDVLNRVLGGALSDILNDGTDDEGPEFDETVNCGFAVLSIDSLPEYQEVPALPESPSGRTAEIFVDLLAEGDAQARLDFATNYVADEFGGDDPTDAANDIEGLQDLLGKHQVVEVLEQDERRFHLLMQGPDGDLLLSVGFDETDPERLACLGVSD